MTATGTSVSLLKFVGTVSLGLLTVRQSSIFDFFKLGYQVILLCFIKIVFAETSIMEFST
jgi:hypothetical protein